MKKGILLLLLAGCFTARGQSLKELLYSGKLKKDSGIVIRKTDDLSARIDTGEKKATEPEKTTIAIIPGDSLKNLNPQADSALATTNLKDSAATAATAETEVKDAAPVKSNSKIWKEYSDSLVNSLKTEVLTSKKIKKETYYLMVEYEIGTDGQVSITNVLSTPENSFLQDQVKERLLLSPPQLSPVLDSTNKPRKVKRKHSFTITKE